MEISESAEKIVKNDDKSPASYFVLEIIQACNNNCKYCYNIWKAFDYPRGCLSMEKIEMIVDKLVAETNIKKVDISGGEPLLRADVYEILDIFRKRKISVHLVTNGTLLTEEAIEKCMERNVRHFQLPLLSHRAEVHNELVENEAWRKVIDAMVNVKKRGGGVTMVFVATAKNICDIKDTLEIAVGLGAERILFNRFNVGGRGIQFRDELLPHPKHLKIGLEILQHMSSEYEMEVINTIPIQPCIIDMGVFDRFGPGFCSAGTEYGYYTIGPQGEVRICNQSPTILGNILEQSMKEILSSPKIRLFRSSIPTVCEPCPIKEQCGGGCRAASEVCYGSYSAREPYLKKFSTF